MAGLSLIEAAEQAATSKVDIWRAIQQGALPAKKTSDGGYAIDPADLFRIFERQAPAPHPTPPEPAPEAAVPAKIAEAAEPPVADDIAAAFATLQAELKTLLGPSANAPPAGDVRPGDTVETPTAEVAAPEANPAGMEAAAADEAQPEATLGTPATAHRSWWRRLAR